VIALYLAQHTPPPGVRFVLLGDTPTHNSQMVALGQGVPPHIGNQVILMACQYDGWSDYPMVTTSPSFSLSWRNSQMGAALIHDYVNARLGNSANVMTQQGNITAFLVPTQHLPLNDMQRLFGPSPTADALEPKTARWLTVLTAGRVRRRPNWPRRLASRLRPFETRRPPFRLNGGLLFPFVSAAQNQSHR
jgi:PE-PPE domain